MEISLDGGFLSTPLKEVETFDNLGLRLDNDLNMKAAVEQIIEKANAGHALVTVESSSLPSKERLGASDWDG